MDWTLLTYLVALQQHTVLAVFAELITILAEDTIIILVGAFLYWCIDAKKGQRMALSAVGGVFWTLGLKNFLKIPRPWDLGIISKEQVLRDTTATGYSFPSGHTTAGANIYGYFASVAKKLWVKVLLWALVVLIALSRIFLGCHTSFDVLAAILISAVWIYVAGLIFDRLLPKSDWYVFVFAVPMLLALCSLFTGFDEDVVKMGAFGFAVLAGIFIERRYIHYEVKGTRLSKAVKFIIGVAVLAALKFWPKAFGIYDIFSLKCLNYALIALWVSCIYPIILKNIKK